MTLWLELITGVSLRLELIDREYLEDDISWGIIFDMFIVRCMFFKHSGN